MGSPRRCLDLCTAQFLLTIYCAVHILPLRGGQPRKTQSEGGAAAPEEGTMIQIDTIQKFSKDNADAALKSFGVVSKGAQAIAVETADYAKKSFEQYEGLVAVANGKAAK